MNPPLRLAMWSGPRNISTAMMRSWGNRPDTAVIDEPFYAFYLRESGADHPGANEVIEQGETAWSKVVERLTSEAPEGKAIFYQKQMTHHLLPQIDRGWLAGLTNCFLIRDPAEVIVSYLKKNHEPTLEDLGLAQQREIFDWVRARHRAVPPVIDAHDILGNPRRTLTHLCDAVGVEFSDAMLSWPAGPRATDGVWAKHWYAEVERSTSFHAPRREPAELPERLRPVHERCREHYEALHQHRLH